MPALLCTCLPAYPSNILPAFLRMCSLPSCALACLPFCST
jgi:hypothetical protein